MYAEGVWQALFVTIYSEKDTDVCVMVIFMVYLVYWDIYLTFGRVAEYGNM